MNNKVLSEHKRRGDFIGILAAAAWSIGLLCAGYVLIATLFRANEMPPLKILFAVSIGPVMLAVFGIPLFRYISRALTVRVVRILVDERLEIVLWSGKTLITKLPEHIEFMVADKDMLTAALKIGDDHFVLDAAHYTNSTDLNNFFRNHSKNARVLN